MHHSLAVALGAGLPLLLQIATVFPKGAAWPAEYDYPMSRIVIACFAVPEIRSDLELARCSSMSRRTSL